MLYDQLPVLVVLAFIIVIGIGIGIGAAVTHGCREHNDRIRIRALTTADNHWAEAQRLVRKAARTKDLDYSRALRNEAYSHCREAEILERGPFRY